MDIFICHATEDKDGVARPIAERLIEAGWQVWFDEFELRLGDRLRAKIDQGLARSRHGAVVLSPHFLKRKPWTEHELDGLMSREVANGGAKVILPIWHEVDFKEVSEYSASLAGRVATTTRNGLDTVVADLDFALRENGHRPSSERAADGSLGTQGDLVEALDWDVEQEDLEPVQPSIAAARAERVSAARALIEDAAQRFEGVPEIAREALYQYFHDRTPLTVGGPQDRFTIADGRWADEHGYLMWADDEPQALTLRHDQPDIAELETALNGVRQFAFDGIALEGKAEAGEWIRPLLKDHFGIADPTFELRPVWRALGFL